MSMVVSITFTDSEASKLYDRSIDEEDSSFNGSGLRRGASVLFRMSISLASTLKVVVRGVVSSAGVTLVDRVAVVLGA